jgi:hypothetical protein
MAKQKVLENRIKRMELYMKENGKMINKKDKEKKFGQMAQYMRANSMME